MSPTSANRLVFHNQAELLCSCSHELQSKHDFLLLYWELCTSGDELYLVHPPISTRCNPPLSTRELDPIDEDLNLQDNSIVIDLDIAYDIAAEKPGTELLWHFSIIYSDTYQAPILYFSVQDPSGTPCPREDVLRSLRPSYLSTTTLEKEEIVLDSWDFISQEKHPYTGYPTFFLHPCQTAQRLKLMATIGADKQTQTMNLLSWMSMIFPAVGQPIPSDVFLEWSQAMNGMGTAQQETNHP